MGRGEPAEPLGAAHTGSKISFHVAHLGDELREVNFIINFNNSKY